MPQKFLVKNGKQCQRKKRNLSMNWQQKTKKEQKIKQKSSMRKAISLWKMAKRALKLSLKHPKNFWAKKDKAPPSK